MSATLCANALQVTLNSEQVGWLYEHSEGTGWDDCEIYHDSLVHRDRVQSHTPHCSLGYPTGHRLPMLDSQQNMSSLCSLKKKKKGVLKWWAGSEGCEILDLQQHGVLLRPQLVSDLQASHQLWTQVWWAEGRQRMMASGTNEASYHFMLRSCALRLAITLDGLAERLGESSQVLEAEVLEIPSLQVSSLNWTVTSCGL